MTTLKTLTLTLLLLLCVSNAVRASEPLSHITSGAWYEIDSKVMNEKRRYALHLPPSCSENKDQKYPVLYVLDGYETRMRGVGGMLEALSYYDLSQQIPEFIVVSIPNTNRTVY